MPKDPVRNVDRYKVRGGHLNAFEFHQNQGAVSQSGDWAGGQAEESELPPDQAKAERIRRLLAEHGESVPEPVAAAQDHTEEDEMNESARNDETREAADFQDEESDQDEQPDDQAETWRTESASSTSESKSNAPQAPPELDREELSEEFAPTHGRSPEVIQEMMQRRRATDVVPDPEDIEAGHPEDSDEDQEHGRTPTAPAERPRKQVREGSTAKAPATTTRKATATSATATRKTTKASTTRARDQQAPARKSAAKVTATKGGKQTAARKSAKQAPAQKGGKQIASTKNTKKAITQKGGNQTATRKSTKKAPARKTASRSLVPARKPAGSKARANATTKTGRAAATKPRAKKAGRKSR